MILEEKLPALRVVFGAVFEVGLKAEAEAEAGVSAPLLLAY